jgi:hypothetical protein
MIPLKEPEFGQRRRLAYLISLHRFRSFSYESVGPYEFVECLSPSTVSGATQPIDYVSLL